MQRVRFGVHAWTERFLPHMRALCRRNSEKIALLSGLDDAIEMWLREHITKLPYQHVRTSCRCRMSIWNLMLMLDV